MREKVGQREDMDASEGASTRLCVHLPRSYDTSCLRVLPPLARHMQNNNVMSISLKPSQTCVRTQDGNK